MVIDGKEKTKTEWKQEFKALLNSYEPEQFLTDQHMEQVLSLLSHHQEADEKIGCGIVAIQVLMEERFGVAKRFDLVRADGSRIDFSYIRCIDKPADHHAIEVRQAFRCEIFPFVFDLKKNHFQESTSSTCAISGEQITRENSHVDHAPPNTFQAILKSFLGIESISPSDIVVNYSDDQGDHSARKLADRKLADRWYDYHAAVAELRMTSAQSNLRQKKY